MSREESLQYLKMKTKEANLPALLGIVNLVEAQQLTRSVSAHNIAWSDIRAAPLCLCLKMS
jgi:hypothetical protein